MSGHEDIVWRGRVYRRHPGHARRNHAVYYKSTAAQRSYLHRDVYEAAHGPIPDGWHVHHIDHDPLNNDPANLTALSPSAHAALHGQEAVTYQATCGQCGRDFTAKRPWAAWCTPACKERFRRIAGTAYKAPRIGPFADPRSCEECSADYIANRPWQRFCSSACKQRYARRAA